MNINKLKHTVLRRAASAAVHHSTHGVVAKVRRQPLRSTTLVSAGLAVGVLAGWLAGRRPA